MQYYSMYEIIDKKKNGQELTKEEFHWVIDSLMNKNIHEYQMSALLMAMFINGLNKKETAWLTDAMLYSGQTLTFEGQNVVDKHSTGGVGDKASFILAPIAAACGVRVPMIAGRGLGHTGGTIDKVESIPGFKTNLPLSEFKRLLTDKGVALIGQTKEIAPADKIIYSLRDVTATVDSIPLITASIMSKKLAEGANGIVMDIKVGSGAFMKNKSQARKLARSILDTAKRFDRGAVALLTNMAQPLGNKVGNAMEIIESVQTLKNEGPKDLTDLSLALAANMIHVAGVESSYAKSMKAAKKALTSGDAYRCFEDIIKEQGGDVSYIKDTSKLPATKETTEIKAPKAGYIKSLKTDEIGLLLTELGGGRKTKTDKIDFAVGFDFNKKVGDKVKEGDTIFTVHHHKSQVDKVTQVEGRFFKDVVKFSKTKVERPAIIIEKLEQ
ncbi:MAG: thymidine phosphorylase [Bacteriovoracaceae bacterium]|nr:thymidine phosphorylase [Bacteriovoracaceae bacterium]